MATYDSDPPRSPDVDATVRTVESAASRSIALIVIAVIAVFAALYVARAFFIPLALAILLNLVLSPVVQWLERLHVAAPAGAALVLLTGLGVLGAGAYELAGPVRHWVAEGPATVIDAARKLRVIIQPLRRVSDAANQVQRETAPDKGRAVSSTPPAQDAGALNLSSRLLVTGQAFVGGAAITLILLYYLLAVGDLFLEKLVDVLPRRGDRQKALSIAWALESAISSYLFLLSAINVGEGLIVAAMTAALGLPNPLLWGAMVAAAEFVPVLGTIAMIVVLTIASITTFDSVTHALLVPAAYIVIDFVQANFVTPLVMGRRLALNPVAVFVALSLWGWLWGVPGFLLAVPLLATFKICCDHVASLASIGAFLGDRDASDKRSAVRARLVRIAMAGRAAKVSGSG